ncbi:MAG: hypothetical protein ABEJ88_02190 [Halobacterium sp.]
MREADRDGEADRERVSRRAFLGGAAGLGAASLAGCLGVLETRRATREPPLPADRPDAPYLPTHTEGMGAADVAANGRYRCLVSYTFPHRFWLVTGDDTERVNTEAGEDVHLMVSVWDAETGVALPAASPRAELTGPKGKSKSVTPWQMLSQQMGVHYGDNVALGPEGRWDVTVRVAPGATRRANPVEPPESPVAFETPFAFERSALEDLPYNDVPNDRQGTKGAVDPMQMPAVQAGVVPSATDFPLEVRGTATTGSAELVVGTADQRGQYATGGDESYLAASLRTPHNRFALPATSVAAEVTRGGETRWSGPLVAALDADLGFHYAAAVPALDDRDGVTVRVQTPPQVARHEGYETAFFEFEPATL